MLTFTSRANTGLFEGAGASGITRLLPLQTRFGRSVVGSHHHQCKTDAICVVYCQIKPEIEDPARYSCMHTKLGCHKKAIERHRDCVILAEP